MEKYILKDFDFKVSEASVLKRYRIEDGDDVKDEVLSLLNEAMSIARPKAVFCIAPIEKGEDFVIVNNTKINNKLMRTNLEEASRVFLHVAICGTEIHEWFEQIDDPVLQFWADGICEMILGTAINYVQNYIKKNYISEGARMNRMSPGSLKEWPISAQPVLFDIIGDVSCDIGVSLTPSCLMVPFKSVSGMYYTSTDNFENCMLCPIIKCPNRRAVYDPEYLNKR